MPSITNNGITANPTRYKGIGYWKQAPGLWRFVDMHEPGRLALVGEQYKTKAELFADLDRYACESWGYGNTTPGRAAVAARYPEAYANHLPRIGLWQVWAGRGEEFPEPLAEGETREAAWALAAANLPTTPRRLSFAELTGEGRDRALRRLADVLYIEATRPPIAPPVNEAIRALLDRATGSDRYTAAGDLLD